VEEERKATPLILVCGDGRGEERGREGRRRERRRGGGRFEVRVGSHR